MHRKVGHLVITLKTMVILVRTTSAVQDLVGRAPLRAQRWPVPMDSVITMVQVMYK